MTGKPGMRQCMKWTLRGQQRGEERVRHDLATEMVLEQLDIMKKLSLYTDLTLFTKTDSVDHRPKCKI